ncbi:MAG: hypothetical protein KC478_04100 [Bacteriovoracaceae bacterium]|nr:hypothetical protein [Bacteriovoracaceae bacterium]
MKLIALLIVTFSVLGQAQEFSYPELNVVPRASDRIRMEVRSEEGQAWKSNLALQLSSFLTLTTGIMAGSNLRDDDEKNYAPEVAMTVGAGWLVASVWASVKYRPYRNSFLKLRKKPYRSKRDKLTKERLAEEEINALSSMGRKIRWASATTNFAASLYLMDAIDDSTDEGKKVRGLASISAVASLIPLFFPYRWETVASEQEKYKKKIYAPVSLSPALLKTNKGLINGLKVTWNF